METIDEQLSRLEMMCKAGQVSWDLSANDEAAISRALLIVRAAQNLLNQYGAMPQVEFVVGHYPFTEEQYRALIGLNNVLHI